MSYHNPPDRRLPYNTHTIFNPSSTVDQGSESDGAALTDIPPYKPFASVSRKTSIDSLAHASKSFENTNSTPQSPQGTFRVPSRTSSRRLDECQEQQAARFEAPTMASSVQSPTMQRSRSESPDSYHTNATSLPALQQKGLDETDQLEPLNEEDIDPGSFDLVAPPEAEVRKQYSLETRSEQLFSTEHLKTIFEEPSDLLRFTAFLSSTRLSSIPILIYYLDAVKALKALSYSNAIAEALDPLPGFGFTLTTAKASVNPDLEEKANLALEALVQEDLPAYITHTYIQTVSLSIQRRITGSLPAHLQEASEGLAEVFCLTDPSRPDNPIVFASEEFHRTTQYGMSYVLGKNCRFLQGPKTNHFSTRRLRDRIAAGREHCEVFLNYRRDGSPFMNLLMIAPLCDSRGTIRYFIGAQVDVSGLVKECSDLDSLKRLVAKADNVQSKDGEETAGREQKKKTPVKDEFQELSEMLNLQELDTVRKWGGRMHRESHEEIQDPNFQKGNWNKTRLLINSISPGGPREVPRGRNGRLSGIYENYLLIRPYPSLRVLFASPSLRVPGILQSPFLNKIGGSPRVREELTHALADGRGVTAKVRWISKTNTEGYNRWIHCTPLLGINGAIGVWMIVVVDDEPHIPTLNRFKPPPPVDTKIARAVTPWSGKDDNSVRNVPMTNGHSGADENHRDVYDGSSQRSGSLYTVRID